MATRGMHFICLYADSLQEWNCSCWRCLIPSDGLNSEHEAGRCPHTGKLYYLPTAVDWDNPQIQKALGGADVLSFQRNILTPEVWAAMDYWRALGKVVTIDIDDHYGDLPPSNPANAYWIQNRAGLPMDPVAALTEGMRHADALTAPSKVLLQDWAHVVPGYYIPNYTRQLWYEPLQQKPVGAPDLEFGYIVADGGVPALNTAARPGSEGWLILGWGGSISHVDSWVYSGIVPALDRIFEKWPNARLKFCGHEDRLNYIFERWGDRVLRQGGVRPEHWPAVVSTFDIGLAPLDLRPLDPPWRPGAPIASYDERRSWLKGIEYLCAGVPWVATDCLTYADLRRHGTLVANTVDDWFGALDNKLTHLAAEKILAWDKRRYALRKFTIESNANAYGDVFGRIMADKQGRAKSRLPGIRYVTAPPTEQAAVPVPAN